jgi:hypothetical protein
MGMVDTQRLLAHEPQQRMGVALLQDLGGHIAAPALVPGAPDRTDSPAPDGIDQLVPSGEDLTHGRASCPLPDGGQDSRAPPGARVPGSEGVAQFWWDW